MAASLYRTPEFNKSEASIRYLLIEAANMTFQDIQAISYYDRNLLIEAIAERRQPKEDKKTAEHYGRLEASRKKNLAQE
jgi:hypothetical protein